MIPTQSKGGAGKLTATENEVEAKQKRVEQEDTTDD